MQTPSSLSHPSSSPSSLAPLSSSPSSMTGEVAQSGAETPSPAGCWRLAPGRALSLMPQVPSTLHIVRGRVWLTTGDAAPDQVLPAGSRITLEPGQHVVMEPWADGHTAHASHPSHDGAVSFCWDALPQARRASQSPVEGRVHDWERSVAKPMRDLLQALAGAGRAVGQAGADVCVAAGRLAAGVAHFALASLKAGQPRHVSVVPEAAATAPCACKVS